MKSLAASTSRWRESQTQAGRTPARQRVRPAYAWPTTRESKLRFKHGLLPDQRWSAFTARTSCPPQRPLEGFMVAVGLFRIVEELCTSVCRSQATDALHRSVAGQPPAQASQAGRLTARPPVESREMPEIRRPPAGLRETGSHTNNALRGALQPPLRPLLLKAVISRTRHALRTTFPWNCHQRY